VEEVCILMEGRNEMFAEIHYHLHRAQNIMKQAADKRRRELIFQPGELVYLKLHPCRMQSLATLPNQKLAPRFYGPYEVLERIGEVAYKLKLPESTKIHPVFHVSLLKQSTGCLSQPQPLPTDLTEDSELLVEPEKVLTERFNKQGA